ncbi:M56 family metallopeptidase [Algibacter sp. R77976]|uniref:M56 family metallopeptidase n=1 Tax=Algibacter sp. R77976 TaxID=3093873 RepID=UPI0037C8D354
MLAILLKSGLCLFIFYGFYKLVLENESIHTFKRFYLLGALILSFSIPLITFTQYVEVIPRPLPELTSELSNNSIAQIGVSKKETSYLPIILWSIYSIGVLIFSLKFVVNLYQLILKIKNNPKTKRNSFSYVLLQNNVVPHTFFNYIFLNKTKFETYNIPKEVLLHEETHAIQKHSIDVVFIEFLQILFWFNPVIYLIKQSIKLNHEFLADKAVLMQGADAKIYQTILLQFSSNTQDYQFASTINYSSIKKRFTIMKTQTSKRITVLKSIIIMPLLAILIYSFSNEVTIEKTKNLQEIAFQNMQANEGATESMMKEYNNFITEYEATKRIYKDKLRRAAAIYDIMTEKQRASVTKYPETRLLRSYSEKELKHPTQEELDSWSQSTDLTISIDAMRIKNVDLNKYKPKDFVLYRLSRKPQTSDDGKSKPTKCFLYTDEGFKRIILKHNFNDYHRLFIKYMNEIDTSVNSKSSDNSELLILKTQLDNLYANFSEEEIKEYHPRMAPAIPSGNKIAKTIKVSEKVMEYNVLAKKYNNPNPKGQRYPREEIDQLYKLYNNLTDEEKTIAKVFPNLPYPIQKKYEQRKQQK